MIVKPHFFSMQLRPFRVYTRQFGFTLAVLPRIVTFIREQRLWQGLLSYGWVARMFILIALLGGMKFILAFGRWVSKLFNRGVEDSVTSMGVMAQELATEGYNIMFSSGGKYVMLILLEVVVFHFARRTVQILTGKEAQAEWRHFVEAQIRMIKVAIRCWILETIILTAASVAFGIFGIISFLEPVVVLVVQCYFLGFAILDNYTEQYDLTIKESTSYAWQYLGVVLGLGLFFYLMLFIPVIGTVAASCISAVAVCVVMYKVSDLHKMKDQPAVDLEPMV